MFHQCFSMSTISSFKASDYMKKFCESLRELTMQLINFEKKTMKLITNKQQKSYENVNICYICKEKFEDKYA